MSLNKREKLMSAIADAIEEADIGWKCSGVQSEHNSDLSLEEWYIEDADVVINQILGIVADYISEVL